MATSTGPVSPPAEVVDIEGRPSHTLAHNSLGLWGLLFCIVTGAAPITAMLFNVPVTVLGARQRQPCHLPGGDRRAGDLRGGIHRDGPPRHRLGRLLQLSSPTGSGEMRRDRNGGADRDLLHDLLGCSGRRGRLLRKLDHPGMVRGRHPGVGDHDLHDLADHRPGLVPHRVHVKAARRVSAGRARGAGDLRRRRAHPGRRQRSLGRAAESHQHLGKQRRRQRVRRGSGRHCLVWRLLVVGRV